MGTSEVETIKEIQGRENIFVAYSQTTKLPYVTCGEESFNDQAWFFTEEEAIKEFGKKKVEEKNVNSEKHKIDAKKDEEKVSVDSSEANGSVRPVKMKRYKISGYRIQIYAGNNSRNSRVEAERAAQRFKGFFPKVPAYTHFYPPRWVCRVGDFKTAEQATAFMSQIQHLKVFSGLIVVKTAIQVAYRSDVSE